MQNYDAHKVNNPSDTAEIEPPQAFSRFYIDRPIVGLTGGIGSGKSAVSDWFAEQGIDIIDADEVSHQIMQKGSPTLQAVVDTLGDWVIDSEGNMDRRAVRQHVFSNDNALLALEAITHPAIRQEIKRQLTQTTSAYVILSAPLLLESSTAGLVSLCDRVLVVDASEDLQLKRASSRDGQTIERIKAIMSNQLSRESRRLHADDVVNNNGSLPELYKQLEPLHQLYLTLQKKVYI